METENILSLEEARVEAAILDAFVSAFPADPYDPCPCGCGAKWKFVRHDGEVQKHYAAFAAKWRNEHASA